MVRKSIVKTGLLVAALVAAGSAAADGSQGDIYLNGHVGYANSGLAAFDVQADFDNAGVGADVQRVDDTRGGWGAGVGYRLLDSLVVEAGYLDLGQIDVQFASADGVRNLESAHPQSGAGGSVTLLYQHNIDQDFHVRVRAGAFHWKADYRSLGDNGRRTTVTDQGTAALWGVGVGNRITDNVAINFEALRFEFKHAPTTYVRAGIEYSLF